VDDAQTAALAQADNLIIQSTIQTEDKSELVSAVRRAVAHHLTTGHAAALLMPSGGPPSSMTRSVLDLVKAHTWRAARLLDAVALMTNAPLPAGRDRLMPTVVEQVVDGFGAEGRLSGFALRAQILDGVPPTCLDEHEILAGVSGAVLATLPLVEHADQPTILIRVATTPASTTVDVVQNAAPVPGTLARRFFEKTATDRPGGACAVAGALAARSFAERHGGSATFEAGPNGAGAVRILLPRHS
jgi:hypothetical protein